MSNTTKGTGTQREKIFNLLKSRAGTWVPCYEIAGLALQYSARLKEIRDSGTVLHNKIQWVDGIRHSWFMMPLRSNQEFLPAKSETGGPPKLAENPQETLFGNIAPNRSYAA
jgi:hypothetical protein